MKLLTATDDELELVLVASSIWTLTTISRIACTSTCFKRYQLKSREGIFSIPRKIKELSDMPSLGCIVGESLQMNTVQL